VFRLLSSLRPRYLYESTTGIVVDSFFLKVSLCLFVMVSLLRQYEKDKTYIF
jgi:hypothetical protein